MASNVGAFQAQQFGSTLPAINLHNDQTNAPGLPVKAANKINQGVLVAYDPANSQAQYADPTMPATAIVCGVNTGDLVDNTTGAKGALKITPTPGIFRLKNDGNVTAAHIFKRLRVVDDHTVGVPAGTDADRPAGICLGLDGSDFVHVLVTPEINGRGPVTVTLTSTNNTAGAAADLTALKAEAEKIGDDVRAIHAALVTAGIIAPAA